MSNTTNLPSQGITQQPDGATKQFFDAYYQKPLEFSSNEVDSVLNFFTKRGFDEAAARSTSTALLRQAKIDNVPIFSVLDTLKGLEEVQLSRVVAEVLNYSRQKTSVLGFTTQDTNERLEKRNILV
jgi:hypothetical protein